LPGVVRQDEDRHVIGRVLPPPALPCLVGPSLADGPEYVTAHDPRTDVLDPAAGVVVIDAGGPLTASGHALEGTGWEQPLVKALAADAEPMGPVLLRPCAESLHRHGETLNSPPADHAPSPAG